MSIKRFDYLFDLYINQTINSEQERELMAMLVDSQNEDIIKDRLGLLYDMDALQYSLSKTKINQIVKTILRPKPTVKRTEFKKALAIAASLLFLLSIATYLFYQSEQNSVDVHADNTDEIKAPTKTKAFIVLSTGTKIPIEDISTKNTLNIGGVQIVRHSNGDIEYKGSSKDAHFHTLENPAGSQTTHVMLVDGTRISLNSGSKLTYPVAFTEAERKVDFTGEAFFEVAHNAKKPFIVQNGEAHIKVLGTTFNVKGYAENKNVEVTLLKGKVKVSDLKRHNSKILLPGQQARIGKNVEIINEADLESAVAWNSETFAFNNQTIEEIAYTLSRWYDVELEFKNHSLNEPFSGIISRKNSLNETIKMLNEAGVAVELSNNKMIF